MHDLRVSDGKREPSWQDLRAVYPPATICRAFWIHGTHILPKPAHFGYMARISCHEPAFFLSEVPLGMHQSTILPSPDTGERISRASCRRRTAENASRTCAHTRMHRWMRQRWMSQRETAASGHLPLSAETAGRRHALRQGGTAAGVRCVRAAGGCGRLLRRGRAVGCVRGHGMEPSAAGNTSCGGNCATRVRMNPFTPTFFRCGTVIKIICYVTNK